MYVIIAIHFLFNNNLLFYIRDVEKSNVLYITLTNTTKFDIDLK